MTWSRRRAFELHAPGGGQVAHVITVKASKTLQPIGVDLFRPGGREKADAPGEQAAGVLIQGTVGSIEIQICI